MINFTIPGKVHPWQRPGFHAKTKTVYEQKDSAKYKRTVKSYALANKPRELILGPIRLEVSVYIMPPKKYLTKPKLKLIEEVKLRPITKPDNDNLVKGIKDGITGIIWKDDSQIVDLIVRKYYSTEPRAEVIIIEVEYES